MPEPEAVFEFLAGRGKPYVLPGAWANLECHGAFFVLSEDPESFREALCAQFAREDLLAAGVAHVGDDGELLMHPDLIAEGAVLAALRRAPQAAPFCILTRDDCLPPGQWPFAAVRDDFQMQSLHELVDGELYIAATLADVAVLWSVGLPAVTATGIGTLEGELLELFYAALYVPSAGASGGADTAANSDEGKHPTRTDPATLFFVDWSPADFCLDPRPEIGAAAHRVVELYNDELPFKVKLALEESTIWKPSSADLVELRHSLAVGPPEKVGDALDVILDHSRRPLLEPRNMPESPEAPNRGYLELHAEWNTARRKQADHKDLQQAWDLLRDAHEREVVMPLMQHALQSDDLLYRQLGLSLAEVVRMTHPQALATATNYGSDIGAAKGKTALLLPPEQFRQFMTMLDNTRSLIRELQKCRR